jgi:hypothetical protein
VVHSETAILGGTFDGKAVPTPSNSWSYVAATYEDKAGQPFTCEDGKCYQIALTGAHSTVLDSFNSGAASSALHFSTVTPANGSKGCARISKAFTKLLAEAVGMPVEFR